MIYYDVINLVVRVTRNFASIPNAVHLPAQLPRPPPHKRWAPCPKSCTPSSAPQPAVGEAVLSFEYYINIAGFFSASYSSFCTRYSGIHDKISSVLSLQLLAILTNHRRGSGSNNGRTTFHSTTWTCLSLKDAMDDTCCSKIRFRS